MGIEVVFLDLGGVIYDHAVYRLALRLGLRDLGAEVPEEEFEAAYEELRQAQAGSFRDALAARFLPGPVDRSVVTAAVARHWSYPPERLHPDVRPCLDVLERAGYRLAVIANQPSEVRAAMDRDGLIGRFGFLGVSDELGLEKPDPRIFLRALEAVGVEAGRAAMVGDRLDYDVRPAKAVGMRTVWVLGGEAPAHPTPEQLAEPDAAIRSLAELPAALPALG